MINGDNNETDKVLGDFEMQTERLTLARQPDQVIINKNKPSANADVKNTNNNNNNNNNNNCTGVLND